MKADAPPRSAAGGSSSSERPSGRRVRGLCHSPASRCPLSETTSPHSVAGKCPSCTRGSGAAPHTHTRVSPQTPGRRGRPRRRAHRPALSPQTAGCTWTCRSSTRKRRSRSRSCRTSCCGTTSTAGSPCACLGLGPGLGTPEGTCRALGRGAGGGPRPLCPLRSCRQPSGPPQRHRNGAPRAGAGPRPAPSPATGTRPATGGGTFPSWGRPVARTGCHTDWGLEPEQRRWLQTVHGVTCTHCDRPHRPLGPGPLSRAP